MVLTMKAATLERWCWVMIYGGLLLLSLGWFIVPHEGPWGELLASAGVVGAIAGVVLVVLRARLKE